MSGQRTLAGRDLAKFVGQIGLLEQKLNSARFSQLYAAQALRHFGRDLKTNPLWQGLSEKERDDWRALLDPLKFYDPKTRNVINLPENYLGVAARLAAIDYQLGLLSDRAMLDTLLDRAAHQFTGGALYADDAPPTGRFDRYSNEYARFIWDAAETAGRQGHTTSVAAHAHRADAAMVGFGDAGWLRLRVGTQPRRGELLGHDGDRRVPRRACGVSPRAAQRSSQCLQPRVALAAPRLPK